MSNSHDAMPGPGCPTCGPLIATAKAAQREWEIAQASHGGRGTPRYKRAAQAKREASALMVTARREHYARVRP